jgi:hypothetical protein
VAFIECRGSEIVRIKHPAGRATAPDAELFAIHLGILRCLWLGDVETILVFTDSVASACTAVDPSTHSGQLHSLAVIWALIPWLEANQLPFPVTTTAKTYNLASCITSGSYLLGLLAVV